MSLDEVKLSAVAMLKAGTTIEETAIALELSPVLISEWYDSIEDCIITKTVQDLVVQQKAIELISSNKDIPKDKLALLENCLHDKALTIVGNLNQAVIFDYEQVKALSIASDIITKMQIAFFKTGPNVAIQNNNNITPSNEGVSTFKELMKD